jgi:hypothetical protein
VLLELLAGGALTLTAIGLLAPHLTVENHEHVLAAARHKTKRDVEVPVATLRPQPAVPIVVRKLPERNAGAARTASAADQNLLTSTVNAETNVDSTAARLVDRVTGR